MIFFVHMNLRNILKLLTLWKTCCKYYSWFIICLFNGLIIWCINVHLIFVVVNDLSISLSVFSPICMLEELSPPRFNSFWLCNMEPGSSLLSHSLSLIFVNLISAKNLCVKFKIYFHWMWSYLRCVTPATLPLEGHSEVHVKYWWKLCEE